MRIIRHADGFQINGAIYVKPDRFKSWVPAQVHRRALQDNGVIIAERADTATVKKKVAGIDGKPRYFAVDMKVLNRFSCRS